MITEIRHILYGLRNFSLIAVKYPSFMYYRKYSDIDSLLYYNYHLGYITLNYYNKWQDYINTITCRSDLQKYEEQWFKYFYEIYNLSNYKTADHLIDSERFIYFLNRVEEMMFST